MKKVFVLFVCIMMLCGCGKTNEEKIIKEFESAVNGSKSYELNGSLDIYNDDDTFTYAIDVGYKKKDMYKVILVNQINSHEQIILKNNEGVYVVTPSLNKSFKFQSEWPKNSSQSYILESLLTDLKRTEDRKYEETDDNYIITTKVDYPNNGNLSYQKLYFDKNMNLVKNEVFDINDKIRIKLIVNKIDYKANLDDEYFTLEQAIDSECCKTSNEETTSNFNEILYPLYIPNDTYLTAKETLNTENGQRSILTFSGEKDFVLVEEQALANNEFEIIPIYGDPLMMNGTVGALSGNSIYWTNNNVDYYIASSNLTQEELLNVANSISNTIVTGK